MLRGDVKVSCFVFVLTILGLTSHSALGHSGPLPSPPPAEDSFSILQMAEGLQVSEGERDLDTLSSEEPIKTIADPLESINRLSFHFNDRLYFWVLKPVASGYAIIVPEPIRVGVRNFFSNVAAPIRVANCLLQLNFKGAGTETVRFFVNTTLGVVGFVDAAKREFNIDKQGEDFGQTLGFYGIGPVFYINWPILGPSSLRDTVGFVGDFFLNPWNYLVRFPVLFTVAIGTLDRINGTSLVIGEYEDLKRAALDPYVAMRDAYYQVRQKRIEE